MKPASLPTKHELSEGLKIARWDYISVEGVLLNIGTIFLQCGHLNAARAIWEALVKSNPAYGPAWYNLSSSSRIAMKQCLTEALRWDVDSVHEEKIPPDTSEEEIAKSIAGVKAAWRKELDALP